jgi:hypothetical protein
VVPTTASGASTVRRTARQRRRQRCPRTSRRTPPRHRVPREPCPGRPVPSQHPTTTCPVHTRSMSAAPAPESAAGRSRPGSPSTSISGPSAWPWHNEAPWSGPPWYAHERIAHYRIDLAHGYRRTVTARGRPAHSQPPPPPRWPRSDAAAFAMSEISVRPVGSAVSCRAACGESLRTCRTGGAGAQRPQAVGQLRWLVHLEPAAEHAEPAR